MSMKLSNSEYLVFLILLFIPLVCSGEGKDSLSMPGDTPVGLACESVTPHRAGKLSAGRGRERYEGRVQRYRNSVPSYSKIQMYGDIGLVSVGIGWDYGRRRQWETDVFIGIIPKYNSDNAKATLTLKQNYIPWSIRLNDSFSFEPLACGLYFNTVLDNNFWTREPSRYPSGYYGFSTRIRTHLFLGERITFEIPYEKRFFARAITAFYEISSCDLYLISAFTNRHLTPKDYLRLSFGLKFQIL